MNKVYLLFSIRNYRKNKLTLAHHFYQDCVCFISKRYVCPCSLFVILYLLYFVVLTIILYKVTTYMLTVACYFSCGEVHNLFINSIWVSALKHCQSFLGRLPLVSNGRPDYSSRRENSAINQDILFFNQQESGQPVLTFGKRNKQLFGNRNPFGVAYG